MLLMNINIHSFTNLNILSYVIFTNNIYNLSTHTNNLIVNTNDLNHIESLNFSKNSLIESSNHFRLLTYHLPDITLDFKCGYYTKPLEFRYAMQFMDKEKAEAISTPDVSAPK